MLVSDVLEIERERVGDRGGEWEREKHYDYLLALSFNVLLVNVPHRIAY